MDIKKVHETEYISKYLVKGTSPEFMNSIRRIAMTQVPCLAIDEVIYYDNDSPTFDEMLANRLGLLPIKTDLKSYKEGDEVKLILEKEGPGAVTSKDIKCTDPKIEILDKKIYITNLPENGRVRIEMKAIMKTGVTHAKHQPGIIAYNEVVSIDNNTVPKDTKELMKELPEGTVELKAGKLFLLDPYNIKIHDQPIHILDKHGVEVNFAENEFVLTVETTGQLTKEEIIMQSLSALNNKFDELKKEVAKL